MRDGDIAELDGDDIVMVDVDAPPNGDGVDMVGGMGDGIDAQDSAPISEFSSPEVTYFLIDRRIFAGIFRTACTCTNLALPRCFPSSSYSFRRSLKVGPFG